MRAATLLLICPPALAAALSAQNVSCFVGEDVLCPGSPHYVHCQGNTCCEGSDDLGSFVCPSAEPGWKGCNRTKRYDCIQGGTPEPEAPEAVPYYPHFDISPDYLRIADRAKGVSGHPGELSDNYYLVIGDHGGCGHGCCCEMQKKVADKMEKYVLQRKRDNPHSTLLFVLALGDNFYWAGVKDDDHFNGTWLSTYAPELLEVPWFAVLGNHDFGNDDNASGCPSVAPRFVCDASNLHTSACGGARPYSAEPQGYSCNQLNAEKGGLGGEARANFQMPDYTYYYSIPELRFELVALDWNWLAAFPGDLGGNGLDEGMGASQMKAHCGSAQRLGAELKGIQEASTKLLLERSAAAERDNVAIFSHYPDEFQGNANLREMFMDGVPEHRKDSMTVFNFFGHTHIQECRGYNERGQCADFLSGGGGGCCWEGDIPAGFMAVSFSNQNASQVTECFLEEPCTVIYNPEL